MLRQQGELMDSVSTVSIARVKGLPGKVVPKRVLNLEATMEVHNDNDDENYANYGPRTHQHHINTNSNSYVPICDYSLDDTDSGATTITINSSDEKLKPNNSNIPRRTTIAAVPVHKLETMRKDAPEISDAFNKSLISFYEGDAKHIELCASDLGEVPEKYRNYPIELCVSAYGLSSTTSSVWGGPSWKYQATVEVIGMNYALRTEVVEKTASPAWCTHGIIPPLGMRNSQKVARDTVVFVTLWRGKGAECEKFVGQVKVRLSDLLWNGIASDYINGDEALGEIFVAADALPSSNNSSFLLMDLTMGPLAGVRPTSKLVLELYRAHNNGTWVPIVRSAPSCEPFKSLEVPLSRVGDTRRMLRLRLAHRTRNRTVSTFQFSVRQLITISKARAHNFLPKMRAPGDTADAQIRVEKTFSPSTQNNGEEISGRLYARLSVIDADECPPRREVIDFGPFTNDDDNDG